MEFGKLSKKFDKYPKMFEEEMKKAYQKRVTLNIDYLTALMLFEEDVKKKKSE